MTWIHVQVPLVGAGVEVSPASSVLGGHEALVQATQHSNHVVMDSPRCSEFGEILRPTLKYKFKTIKFCDFDTFN